MKQILKKIGKKAALVLAAAAIAGSGATVGVFAAIPHSTTGLISACYTNTTGALRVIDSEANATCDTGETALSWSSSTTDKNSALLRLTPDPNDNTTFVMDNTRSRNVLDLKTIELGGSRYVCIKVAFHPEVKLFSTDTGQLGGGGFVDMRIPDIGSDFSAGVESVCGTGYNAIIFLNGSPVNATSVMMSN